MRSSHPCPPSQELRKSYEDHGPVIDAVVWHDGSVWRAALDTSELHEEGSSTGALADFAPMTDFKTERQYGTFSAADSCNFAVNIYEEGKILSIVVDAGAHGTHVAGALDSFF